MGIAADSKAITLGHPSYVWRAGQERRLQLIRQYVPLEGRAILDVGCGLGLYVQRFRDLSEDVHGVDIDPAKVAQAGEQLSNIRQGSAEALPYPDETFDVVFSNEVIEHVQSDQAAIDEAYRVLVSGGHLVVFCPNRGYPFETHGCYWRGSTILVICRSSTICRASGASAWRPMCASIRDNKWPPCSAGCQGR